MLKLYLSLIILFGRLYFTNGLCTNKAPSTVIDTREYTETFTLMQFNVEWLFTQPPYNGCPGSGCTWKTETDAYNHLDYISSNNCITYTNNKTANLGNKKFLLYF
jgi:hypothetical protein